MEGWRSPFLAGWTSWDWGGGCPGPHYRCLKEPHRPHTLHPDQFNNSSDTCHEDSAYAHCLYPSSWSDIPFLQINSVVILILGIRVWVLIRLCGVVQDAARICASLVIRRLSLPSLSVNEQRLGATLLIAAACFVFLRFRFQYCAEWRLFPEVPAAPLTTSSVGRSAMSYL